MLAGIPARPEAEAANRAVADRARARHGARDGGDRAARQADGRADRSGRRRGASGRVRGAPAPRSRPRRRRCGRSSARVAVGRDPGGERGLDDRAGVPGRVGRRHARAGRGTVSADRRRRRRGHGRARHVRGLAAGRRGPRGTGAVLPDVRVEREGRPLPDRARPRRTCCRSCARGVDGGLRRRLARGRGGRGGPRLPPRRVPLRHVTGGHARDDGRRPLLARLRRRRVARPLRRQLLLGRGLRPLGGAGRAPSQRPLPQRPRPVRGRRRRLRRRPAAPRQRLRRRRLQRGRAHGPLRHRRRATTSRPTATTPSSGGTATGRSRRAHAPPGSARPAGTRAPPSGTSTATAVPTCSSRATPT